MTLRVLILGGTTEARRLAGLLADDPGIRVTSALAGRTATPRTPAGDVRVGGFGGADGLADWLRANGIHAVIDATHPFATMITANAVAATRQASLPLLILRRPGWQPRPGDDWHWAASMADMTARLPALGRRVFLTTGRTDLAPCTDLPQLWFLLRSVDPPDELPHNVTVIQGRGPFTVAGELALLRDHRIDVLVTRDSGGTATAAKLDAARTQAIPVVLISRPALPDVATVATEHDAVAWLSALRDP
jgi:precorrin-6A/cobalt-precorrin-6A reductase